MSYQILILAAGKGTRMKSDLPKVLHEAAFHPLLHYVLTAAEALPGTITTVVGHGAEVVEAAFAGRCNFALQREQHGTGHAVREALPALPPTEEDVVVLCGDTPLLRGETLQALTACHAAEQNDCTVLTATVADATGYGRIIRDADGRVLKIVEQRDADERELAVREINSGVYCFGRRFLEEAIAALKDDNDQGELYLTDAVAYACARGYRAGAYHCDAVEEIIGVNDRVQLAAAGRALFVRKNDELMRDGVTMIDPASAHIDPLATIGRDTLLEPQVIVRGACRIGERCHLGPQAELIDTAIGDDCRFWQSIANQVQGGNGLNIGPFAYLRPGCELADRVKVGDFVEVKNSVVGVGTKIPHLTYLGDSDVGAGTNIGCGSITCNYDGVHKYRTTIGDRAFIGSNATMVAPLTVGDGAFIAAGSTVTKDVPADALAVGRERQRNVEGWAKKFRETQK